jgi:hypothetical protein
MSFVACNLGISWWFNNASKPEPPPEIKTANLRGLSGDAILGSVYGLSMKFSKIDRVLGLIINS